MMLQEQPAGIHLAAAVLFALNVAVLAIINTKVPDSYMDEPFHVGQTQKYCQGLYHEWDPKITTFPGLYFVGTAAGWLYQAIRRMAGDADDMDLTCGVGALRVVNVFLSVACLYTLHAVITALQAPLSTPKQQGKSRLSVCSSAATTDNRVIWALALSALPLHWSYSYLYYTDVGSTLLLLLCYLACLNQRPTAAAASAVGAVLFRQTNAVWVAFVMGATALRMVRQAHPNMAADVTSLWEELQLTLSGMWRIRAKLAAMIGPMAAVPAAFVVFLVLNGGVTVGDREAHKPVKHWAQLQYFALYTAVMLAAQLVPGTWRAIKTASRQPAHTTLCMGAAVLALYAAAVASQRASPPPHPYLLADNRHYTFYIWRKLIDRPGRLWGAAVLAPAAAVAWAALLCGLRCTQQRLWVAGWALCTAVVLVPAWLLEFRYFTLPLLLAALHLPRPSTAQAAASLCIFAAINAATLYMFTMRPFTWADGSVARFMW